MFVRPIRPESEPLIHEFLRHVTSHDLRLRFFAPMKECSHEFIARLTQLDYARDGLSRFRRSGGSRCSQKEVALRERGAVMC